MFEFKIKKFDKLKKEIHELANSEKKLRDHEEELDLDREIPIHKLFHDGFMKRHTDFQLIHAFFDNSEWNVRERQDFGDIPEEDLDEYVREHSKFNSWADMKTQAVSEYMQIR